MKKAFYLFILIIGVILAYGLKTEFGDLPYPPKIKSATLSPCMFTIEYSSNDPKSKDYALHKDETLPLNGLESISKKSCRCIEEALKFKSGNNQQFSYVDIPYFIVDSNNSKFNITIEVKDTIGTKRLNFNKIAKDNIGNICSKWRY